MSNVNKEALARALSRVPATREAAIAALVETDVARWGESERAASARLHANRTLGLALTELATRAELWLELDPADFRAAAKMALTSADRAYLRTGG